MVCIKFAMVNQVGRYLNMYLHAVCIIEEYENTIKKSLQIIYIQTKQQWT